MLRLLGWRRSKEEQRDELLSAYLDGELSEREREQLETRLSQDSALRAELRALHQTVSLVHQLPQVSAPRNFILSESMLRRREPAPAPEPRRAWAAPLLTAATAVVSLLFVVVLAGDLLLPGAGGLASAPAPMEPVEEAAPLAEEVRVTTEVESEVPAQPTPSVAPSAAPLWEEPEVTVEEEPKQELSAAEATRAAEAPPGMGGAEDTTPAEEAPEEPEVAVEEELSPAEATRAAQPPPGAGATPPPPVEEAGPTEEVRSVAAPTTPPTVTERFVLTPTIPPEEPLVSEEELGLLEPTPSELEATPPPVWEQEGLREARVPWRALEVALGLAALVLTFGTIQAWRARRR